MVEVFDSSASAWTAGGGKFASDCSLLNNLVYYIAYGRAEGLRQEIWTYHYRGHTS